jgi:hypothetical protein
MKLCFREDLVYRRSTRNWTFWDDAILLTRNRKTGVGTVGISPNTTLPCSIKC